MKKNFIEIEKDNGEAALINVNEITGVTKFEEETNGVFCRKSVSLAENESPKTCFKLVINFNNGTYFVKYFEYVLPLRVEYERIKRALMR